MRTMKLRTLLTFITFLVVSKILKTDAIQYAKECTVDGKQEMCLEVTGHEKDINEYNHPPPEILFDDGGTKVFAADCVDEKESCKTIIEGKDSELCQPEFRLRETCKRSCQICTSRTSTIGSIQTVGGTQHEIEGTQKVIKEMVRYLREEVLMEREYELMFKECVNTHELCAFWASIGECENNPTYMLQECMLACKKCSEHPEYLAW